MKSGKIIIISIVASIFLFTVYNISLLLSIVPNGHGSEANYNFEKSKFELEIEIDSLIAFDSSIVRKKLDLISPDQNYYNKDGYFTLIINNVEYVFRYYGDSSIWNNSLSNSEIFIAHIKDYNTPEITNKECLNLIEKIFINKLKSRKK